MISKIAVLQEIPQLLHVPKEQLQWLVEKSSFKKLLEGDFIFKRGDSIDTLFVVLEGKIEIKLEQHGQYKSIGTIEKNGISGLLPFSQASSALGVGEVVKNTEILQLNGDYFKEMIAQHYELTEALVHVMTSRVREFTKDNVQEEKMMALGKLSAGLAHELNNPASAILRSAESLQNHLGTVPEKFKQLMLVKYTEAEIDQVNQILFSKLNHRTENQISLIERNELEDKIEIWLEDHQVTNAFELTETLVDFGFDIQSLETIQKASDEKNFPIAIEWIENVLTTEKMVTEIKEASERISKLVNSVKSYTHMDRAPEKEAEDIQKGIKSTLTMLNHKIKQKSIAIDIDYKDTLPKPKIFISEINQVWTNILDNAIDAVDQNGKILIRIIQDGDFIKIEIKDNGAGIYEKDLPNIFDPFYTTKAIGKGTGMGLEVVQRIIHKHNGNIKVKSKPGETIFTIYIPIT